MAGTHKPGIEPPRGGELAAEDCWLEGYNCGIAVCPSKRFVGEVAPDVNFGDPAAEYPLGDPLVDVTFGVAVGVRRGAICGAMEKFCPAGFATVTRRWLKLHHQQFKFLIMIIKYKFIHAPP